MMERQIIKLQYSGQKDNAGLPHGEGCVHYLVDGSTPPFPQYPDLKGYYREVGTMVYKGGFEHGVRQGKGYFALLGLVPGVASRYEWYSEGDYDCGRLVRPTHPEGSYRDDVRCIRWYTLFQGTWQDDMPLKRELGYRDPNEAELQLIRSTGKEELGQTLKYV